MSSQPPERPEPETWPAWPYASLLLFGIFGAGDEAGRGAALRGAIGLAVFILGLGLMADERVFTAGSVVMLGGITFLILSTVVYIRALDELTRLIQLEAIAWSYGIVFLVFFVAVTIGGGFTVASVNPALIVIGEPIRGLALVAIARRYR